MTMGFLLINMLLLAGCYCTSIWDTAVGVPNWSWWSAFAGDRSTQCESDDIKVAQHPFLFSSLAFHSQNLQVPFCSEVVAPSPSPHPRYLQGAGGVFQLHMWAELCSLLSPSRAWVWDGCGCTSHGNACSHHSTHFGNLGPPQGPEAGISKKTLVSQRHGAQLSEKGNIQGSEPGITRGKIAFPVRLEAADHGRKRMSTCWGVKSLPVCHRPRWSWGWRTRHKR